jgi:hypothetical protein
MLCLLVADEYSGLPMTGIESLCGVDAAAQ